MIVVDPRFSVAAGKAKHYLPIKPGTDIALLLAWMNVIVAEELYDQAFVEQLRLRLRALQGRDRDAYTPEWAYPETGIQPEQIRETAREMARHRPATLVHPGRHVTWYGDDTQRSRAMALLNALLGSWGRKGGFYYPSSMDVRRATPTRLPEAARGRRTSRAGSTRSRTQALTTGIRDATLTGEPYPIKGWFVYATNLDRRRCPTRRRPSRRSRRSTCWSVVDVIPSEITGWADVVLPESTYLERYDDLNVEYFRDPFVALRQPVVEPPDDQKPNWWIARELAKKLGLGDYYPWKDIEEYLDERLEGAGLSLAALKEQGLVKGQPEPAFYDDGIPPDGPTPSGKIEFYSAQLEQAASTRSRATRQHGAAAGQLPAAVRPRAGALLQPHARPTRCCATRCRRTTSG